MTNNALTVGDLVRRLDLLDKSQPVSFKAKDERFSEVQLFQFDTPHLVISLSNDPNHRARAR